MELMKGLLSRGITILLVSGILGFFITLPAFADEILDLDGTESKFKGPDSKKEVFPGADLIPWPTGVPDPDDDEPKPTGIDWMDQDTPQSKTWTDVDTLFSEDPQACPGTLRDQKYNAGSDCLILEGSSGPPANLRFTDCDLEGGGSPSHFDNPAFGFSMIPCQDTRTNFLLTFHDANGDGFYNDFDPTTGRVAEDIVLDTNGNLKFDPPVSVGGQPILLDNTTLVLAGTQFTTSWLIPALVAAIGIGLVITRKI